LKHPEAELGKKPEASLYLIGSIVELP